MRTARSYSIVDHQLLHGGYFHRLRHSSLALYLFLVVVGDKDGRSFYGEKSLSSILHLTEEALEVSIDELMEAKLIHYKHPYFWVRTLGGTNGQGNNRKDQILKGRKETIVSSDRGDAWIGTKDCLKSLLQQFS
jgi:hypothetical protein